MATDLFPVRVRIKLVIELAPELDLEVFVRDELVQVGIELHLNSGGAARVGETRGAMEKIHDVTHLFPRHWIQERPNSLEKEVQQHGKVGYDRSSESFDVMVL